VNVVAEPVLSVEPPALEPAPVNVIAEPVLSVEPPALEPAPVNAVAEPVIQSEQLSEMESTARTQEAPTQENDLENLDPSVRFSADDGIEGSTVSSMESNFASSSDATSAGVEAVEAGEASGTPSEEPATTESSVATISIGPAGGP
jgi:hypothetical protein